MSATTRTPTSGQHAGTEGAAPSATPGRGSGAPSFLEAARLVAAREVAVKLRDRGFLISTLVTLALVVAAFVLPAVLEGRASSYTVATAGAGAEDVARALADAADAPVPDGEEDPLDFAVEVTSAGSAAAAEDAVRAGEADLALVGTDAPAGDDDVAAVEAVAERSVPDDLREGLVGVLTAQRAAEVLAGLGADAGTAEELLTPSELPERFLDPDGEQGVEALILGVAFALVFFFTALTFGLAISQSVTEEKQNRVVELLVAVAPVRALLVGKVVGNVVLALGQLVLLLAVGLLAASVAGQGDVVPLLTGSAGWFVVYFLAGFTMLACLWAAAGALASRVEDLGATTLPVQLLILVPFFVSVNVQDEGPVRTALSWFPLSAPLVMPQRLVAGEASTLEGVLALAGIALTGVLLVLVAERLYRGSLLRTRGRASLREAWAAARG